MVAAVNGKGSSSGVGAVKSLSGMRVAFGVLNTTREQRTSAPITVVVNWAEGLKK